MTLNAAIKIIEREAEFLGRSFDWVMQNCVERPGIFKMSTVEAYKVISESE